MHLKANSLEGKQHAWNDALNAFEGKQPCMKWCFICIWRQTALHELMLYMHLKANSLTSNDALNAFEGKQPCMKWCFICIWRQIALHEMMQIWRQTYMKWCFKCIWRQTALHEMMLYMYLKANSLTWIDALNAFEGKQPLCMNEMMLYMYLKANSLTWIDALNAFEGKQPCMKWCFICIWRQTALHELML